MSNTSLVQLIKDLRDKQSRIKQDVVSQKVSWDIDPGLIGQPINGSLISHISNYIDRRLEEYSSILGSMPAVESNVPTTQATLRNLSVGDVYVQQNDDHVAHDCTRDSFLRINTTMEDEVLRDCVTQARASGIPAGAVFSDGSIDCCEGNNDEHTNLGQCIGLSVRRIPDSSVEGIRPLYINTQDGISVCNPLPESIPVVPVRAVPNPNPVLNDTYDRSFLNGGDLDALVNSQGILPEVPTRVRDSFVRPLPDLDHEVTRVERTPNLREYNTTDPLSPRVKPFVNAVKVITNPTRTPWPWPRDKLADTTSYITSYDLDYATLKISARVITVPTSMKVDHEMWFSAGSDRYDVREVIRKTIKSNLTIMMNGRSGWSSGRGRGIPEEMALETLREMITEIEFKKYLKNGFVVVRGNSGDIYQVFRDKWHTKVWRGNKVVEEICVRLKDSIIRTPPTDDVIAFMTMILTDESAFRKAGNVYKMA